MLDLVPAAKRRLATHPRSSGTWGMGSGNGHCDARLGVTSVSFFFVTEDIMLDPVPAAKRSGKGHCDVKVLPVGKLNDHVTEDIMLEWALRLAGLLTSAGHGHSYRGHHARKGAVIADF